MYFQTSHYKKKKKRLGHFEEKMSIFCYTFQYVLSLLIDIVRVGLFVFCLIKLLEDEKGLFD